MPRASNLLALGAIGLWATLATAGVLLSHVPPFLLTGLGLLIGSIPALPFIKQWRVPLPTLALGVYGLFGFHFLFFMALRHAPAVQANLIVDVWPLLMVVLAPIFLPGTRLRAIHLVAAVVGSIGAAIAISDGLVIQGGFSWGYVAALASAFVWASYSLLCKRVAPFPTAAIGGFTLLSGLLSLLCHVLLEPAASLNGRDALLMIWTGLGPLGAAFFLWDAALKRGNAQSLGLLSFLVPLLATLLLLLVRQQMPSLAIVLAAGLIIGAAVVGARE